MSLKKLVSTGFALVVLAGVLVFGRQAKQGGPPQAVVRQQSEAVPDHVTYEHFFNVLASLKNVKDYQRDAELSEEQTALLELVANDCLREVAAQDAKAMKVIRLFRAGVEKLQPGGELPPPPSELKALQEGRDAIVRRHRARLQSGLGQSKFEKLDQSVKQMMRISVVPVPAR